MKENLELLLEEYFPLSWSKKASTLYPKQELVVSTTNRISLWPRTHSDHWQYLGQMELTQFCYRNGLTSFSAQSLNSSKPTWHWGRHLKYRRIQNRFVTETRPEWTRETKVVQTHQCFVLLSKNVGKTNSSKIPISDGTLQRDAVEVANRAGTSRWCGAYYKTSYQKCSGWRGMVTPNIIARIKFLNVLRDRISYVLHLLDEWSSETRL